MVTRKKTEQKTSVWWKLLLVVLLIQIPFCGFFAYSAAKTVENVNEQLASSQINALTIFRNTLQKQLQNAEEYLYTQCWGTEAFTIAGEAKELATAEQALTDVFRSGQEFLDTNSNISRVAIIIPQIDAGWVMDKNGHREDADLLELVGKLSADVSVVNCGWSVQQTDGRSLLVRVCGYGDIYGLVSVDLEALATDARANHSMPASLVLRKGDRLITEALWTRGSNGILSAWRESENGWYFVDNPIDGNRYQVTEISFAGMTICMGTLYQYDWTWLYAESFLLMGVVVLTMLIGLMYLRQAFFLPLSDLVSTMGAIRQGKRLSREFHYRSREFSSIQDSFNEMVDALEQQRITSYENELKARRSEMQSLRLQIRRHFFLNCLKNIYAMANSGDMENIKQMVLLLSTNLRYTLDFHKDAVELETELQMCEKYVLLQGIGQKDPPVLTISLDPKLGDFLIPPVSVLTMLENCCKYGSRQDTRLKITISAACRSMDDQEYVCVAVQDNGLGFPQEMLYKLNNDLDWIQQEGHVGIVNTMTRIRMLYGKDCEVLFSNRGGARIEWIIPVRERGKE